MKIPEAEIEVKKIAGESGNGAPVVYILTKGGLHAMFTKDESGKPVPLGASPHVAITRWLSEQKDPKIKWNEDFIQKGEAFIDDLQKSEQTRFLGLRRMILGQTLEKSITDLDAYLVYRVQQKSFLITDAIQLQKSIEAGEISRYDIIRHMSMTKPAYMAEDHPEFGQSIRSRDV